MANSEVKDYLKLLHTKRDLVISGYIRQIEVALNGAIIPLAIVKLCFDYYYNQVTIYFSYLDIDIAFYNIFHIQL